MKQRITTRFLMKTLSRWNRIKIRPLFLTVLQELNVMIVEIMLYVLLLQLGLLQRT